MGSSNFYDYFIVSKRIAHQLRKMKANIVGFEEVFHTEGTKHICFYTNSQTLVLKRAIDKSGMYNGSELVAFGADGSKPCVALVSQYPVLGRIGLHFATNFCFRKKIYFRISKGSEIGVCESLEKNLLSSIISTGRSTNSNYHIFPPNPQSNRSTSFRYFLQSLPLTIIF